jgi:hypothetical protein
VYEFQLQHLEARKWEIAAALKPDKTNTEIAILPNLPDLHRREVAGFGGPQFTQFVTLGYRLGRARS